MIVFSFINHGFHGTNMGSNHIEWGGNMSAIVYVTSENKARFECPKCHKSKTVDADRFRSPTRTVRVKVRCPCGHKYDAILEKRRGYRKEVSLPGSYVHIADGREAGRGAMTVRDISTGGMKLRMTNADRLNIGDVLQLEFRLDDARRSLLQKKVIVRNIEDMYVGVEFAMTQATDKALGFYLFS
jgi:hypothetical protein